MAALQSRAADGVSHRRRSSFTTSGADMKRVLDQFAQAAEDDCIWVSSDVQELQTEDFGNWLCQIVGMALDTARQNCIETTSPRGRYIRIRSRYLQEQMLIKIQYSCEECMIRGFDKNIARLRTLVEGLDGYLKLQLDDAVGNIKIAIPAQTLLQASKS